MGDKSYCKNSGKRGKIIMGSQPKDPELLEIPGTEGVDGGNNAAVQQMIDLMGTELTAPEIQQNVPLQHISQNVPGQQISQNVPGQQISQDIPLQQIAGMSANEQTVQGMLSKYLGTSATDNQAYQAGMGEINKTLGEDYNPLTSDFWKGYRDTSQMEQDQGVSDIRRRGQLGGGLYATPNQRTEADYNKGMGAQRMQQLGGLYEHERDRKSNAVNQALGYAGFEEQGISNRLSLGSTIGATPRNIKNQQNEALYNQQTGQMNALNQQNQADYNQQMGQMGAVNQQGQADYTQQMNQMTALNQQNTANYNQQTGQMNALNQQNQADYNQQLGSMNALNQQNAANYNQGMGEMNAFNAQEQSNYATQLAQIGIQSGAAGSLMPQWNIDQGGGSSPLGAIGSIASAIITGK